MPAVVRDGGNYTGHYWVGGGWLLQGLPTHIHDDDDHHDDDRDDDDHDYDDVLYSWIRKVSYPLQHFSHPGLHCQLWINILIILSIVCVVNFTGNTNITIKLMSIKIEIKSHHCSKYLSARKSCNP